MSPSDAPAPIALRLESDLKTAMRARDKERVSCIRQLKAKAQEAENAPGFAGPKDDTFWSGIIGKYAKMLSKSLDELSQGGERGEALIASYRQEIAYCEQFLPKALSDEELQQAAATVVQDGHFTSPQDVGRALGQLLGRYKGQVDPKRAKAALQAALQGSGGAS